MKVLMLSGDPSILEEGSAAHARLLFQRSQVDRLDVFVWPQRHSFREIVRATRVTQPDVVTAQDPFWRGLAAWVIARRCGARLNLQVHTDLTAQPFTRRVLARFLLARADSIRVVSEKLRDTLVSWRLRAPIVVLPIFVDLAPCANMSHTPHSRFTKTILWIGRFEEEKDPLMALEVLVQVRARGIDAGLIMLGAGSLEGKLRERAKQLAPFVEFPGWQAPAPYLAQADVVVSTSRHESYGASIVEALAAGVPVVSPDYGIAREAGAVIASRTELTAATAHVLQTGMRGELKMPILDAESWAKRWRESLEVVTSAIIAI